MHGLQSGAVLLSGHDQMSGCAIISFMIARKYLVRGFVQGVGYRAFVIRHAQQLGLAGYAKNLDDGRVEVHAQGPEKDVETLAGYLHQGPRFSDVRGVEQLEVPLLELREFSIRH